MSGWRRGSEELNQKHRKPVRNFFYLTLGQIPQLDIISSSHHAFAIYCILCQSSHLQPTRYLLRVHSSVWAKTGCFSRTMALTKPADSRVFPCPCTYRDKPQGCFCPRPGTTWWRHGLKRRAPWPAPSPETRPPLPQSPPTPGALTRRRWMPLTPCGRLESQQNLHTEWKIKTRHLIRLFRSALTKLWVSLRLLQKWTRSCLCSLSALSKFPLFSCRTFSGGDLSAARSCLPSAVTDDKRISSNSLLMAVPLTRWTLEGSLMWNAVLTGTANMSVHVCASGELVAERCSVICWLVAGTLSLINLPVWALL